MLASYMNYALRLERDNYWLVEAVSKLAFCELYDSVPSIDDPLPYLLL